MNLNDLVPDLINAETTVEVMGNMALIAGGAADTLSVMKGSVIVDLRDPPTTFDSDVLPRQPQDNSLSGLPESVGTTIFGARYLN